MKNNRLLTTMIIIRLIFSGGKITYGQQGKIPDPFAKLSAPSPATAALVKFTDIPVSGFTGTPDINIPLYEISTAFVRLPVTLSYHASGITVEQEATNVGLGWALNAGGVLSRTVVGKVDNGTWQTDRMNRQSSFDISNPVDFRQAPLLLDNTIDGVPDLYMYNFAGYSGKFIIADQLRQLPLTNTRITKISENEFHIITPDGNKYIFSAPEVSRNRSENSASFNIVAWYLTKILSADRTDSVLFSYADTRYVSGGGVSFTREFYKGASGDWNGPAESAQSSFENLINGKQLVRIDFRQGSVTFNISWNTREDLAVMDNGAVPLVSSMVVKNNAGTILRTVNFRYGYFTNGAPGADNKRLQLSAVYIHGGNSTDTLQAQRYHLGYNNMPLPAKSSLSQDHWGYYNGAENTTLIPSYTNCVNGPTPPDCYSCAGQPGTLNFPGADRNTKGAYASAGMLERITYPTGGYAAFEWEPHEVADYEAPVISYRNERIGSTYVAANTTLFVKDSSTDFYVDPVLHPGGLCARIDGIMAVPGSAATDDALIDHAGGSITLYKRTGRVAVASYSFSWSPAGAYNWSSNVKLEAGQRYFLLTTVRHAGFSVRANMSANVRVTANTGKNKIVGGCRLKRTVLYDPVAELSMVKTYNYRHPSDTALSSGTIRRPPLYVKNVQRFEQQGKGCDYFERSGIRLSSNSIASLGAGSHVGYTYVRESIGEGGANGYIIYNYENRLFNNEFNPGWRSGYLIAKTIYNAQGSPVNRERNVYSTDSRGDTSFMASTVDYYVKHPCANVLTYDRAYPAYASGKDWIFPSEWFHLDSTITDNYDIDVPSRVLTTAMALIYDNVRHLQVTKTIEKNAAGLDVITSFRYPLDYVLPAGTLTAEAQAIRDMQTANIHALTETYKQQRTASGVLQLQGATYQSYRSVASAAGPVILQDKQYTGTVTVPAAPFAPSAVAGTGITKSAVYYLRSAVNKYDACNNISEIEKEGGEVSAYIWDHKGTYLVAAFNNARLADVAYTGFEGDNKGNWRYAGMHTSDATAVTGRNSYQLTAGAITSNALTASMTYTLSYWLKSTTPLFVAGTVSGYPLKGTTLRGWTYFEHKLTGITVVTLSGNSQIDELRLYPAGGSVTTWSYDPLTGVTGSCSESNMITRYSYDQEGRLNVIRDQDGNILQQTEYRYQAPVGQ
ncbi:RHS repeat domain-containing protein [Chitinophaga agri]|uniref:YD repeat-containing protein n=1 Tax=Chitinophaga agri TaxID=2703787 RepID=A0A6B9ZNK3_9BACT|nr:hypothetical protein [Chitinophaga agri]QHS63211.1 hypothetical protein GWR21_27585 [Chitinophaga agri]